MGIEQLGVLNKAHRYRRRSDEIRFGKSNRFLNPLAVREEKWDGGRWGQRAGLSEEKEARGEAATYRNGMRQSGRWGI